MGPLRKTLLLFGLLTAACATTMSAEDCRKRAETSYRECINPTWQPQSDDPKVTTSDQQQGCRARYQQSLDACGGGSAPMTKTSTKSGPFDFE